MTDDKPVKRRDPLYITIIILLIGASAFCAYQWNYFSNQEAICANDYAQLDSYVKELEADLGSSGLDLVSTDLRENLLAMLGQMDTLQTDNVEMQDSINAQRSRVTVLLAELDEMKKTGKNNRRTILKLRAETETLRKVMRFQVHKIDSLHRLNLEYVDQIEGHVATIKYNQGTIENLQTDKTDLEAQVDIGSKLQTSGVKADALRVRSSGNYKETPRAKSTNMIRACFTIMANPISAAGDKAIYMRIVSPNGGVLNDGSPELFNAGESQKEASIKRVVNYQKENMDLCIYFDVETAIDPGDYMVKIFCEGKEIGSTSFSLK
jgi:hypothetical protein